LVKRGFLPPGNGESVGDVRGALRRRDGVGLQRLLEAGLVERDERIVLFNTAAGLKYPEWFAPQVPVVEPDVVHSDCE
jgi:hypothetical protein